jgi:hypothetical protein
MSTNDISICMYKRKTDILAIQFAFSACFLLALGDKREAGLVDMQAGFSIRYALFPLEFNVHTRA